MVEIEVEQKEEDGWMDVYFTFARMVLEVHIYGTESIRLQVGHSITSIYL